MYNYNVFFLLIREEIKRRHAAVKVIPYTESPEITMMTPGPEYQKYVENQVTSFKRERCDAVILGNGG